MIVAVHGSPEQRWPGRPLDGDRLIARRSGVAPDRGQRRTRFGGAVERGIRQGIERPKQRILLESERGIATRRRMVGDDLTSLDRHRMDDEEVLARRHPAMVEEIDRHAVIVERVLRATVNSWRHAGKVLALEGATRGFRFPQWQVGEDGKPFGALPRLFEIFGDDAWAVFRFPVQHQPAFDGETGLALLRRHEDRAVLAAAKGVATGDFA